jgi:hypothetical protein
MIVGQIQQQFMMTRLSITSSLLFLPNGIVIVVVATAIADVVITHY